MRDFFHKIHDELIYRTLDTALRKIVHTFAIPIFAIPIPAFIELAFDPLDQKKAPRGSVKPSK